MFDARAIWVQMQKQTTFAYPIHIRERKDTQMQSKSFSQSHSDMEPMEPVFFHLTFQFVFALPKFTCVNKSAIEVQEYFFPFLLPALVLAFAFLRFTCVFPCVCISVISVNHAWGSCLYCISQLKSMVHDDKLSIDFFLTVYLHVNWCIPHSHLLINSHKQDEEFLFLY